MAAPDYMPVTVEDDPRDRYRLYVVADGELRCLAACESKDAIGTMIVTLHEDEREHGRRLYEQGQVGLLDAERREWIILPWGRPQPPVTFGPGRAEVLLPVFRDYTKAKEA